MIFDSYGEITAFEALKEEVRRVAMRDMHSRGRIKAPAIHRMDESGEAHEVEGEEDDEDVRQLSEEILALSSKLEAMKGGKKAGFRPKAPARGTGVPRP